MVSWFTPNLLYGNQKTLMYCAKESESVTAGRSTPDRERSAGRFQIRDDGRQLAECVRIEGVVDPASVFPIEDQAGVLEHFQMKREARLCGVQFVLQVAHAALSVLQHREDAEASLVGEGVEKLGGSCQVESGAGHSSNISTVLDAEKG